MPATLTDALTAARTPRIPNLYLREMINVYYVKPLSFKVICYAAEDN